MLRGLDPVLRFWVFAGFRLFVRGLRRPDRQRHAGRHPSRRVTDPDEDHVIAFALVALADAIVSGDRDLLDLPDFHDIPSFTASQALTLIEQSVAKQKPSPARAGFLVHGGGREPPYGSWLQSAKAL